MGDQQPSLFEGEKECRVCKESKDINLFVLYDNRGKLLRKNICIPCEREYNKNLSRTPKQRERRRLWQKRYRERNRKEYNARNRKWKSAKREADRNIIYKAYGGKCACCGETNSKFFTVDHVNNDGHIQRKTGRYTSGSQFYRDIIKQNFPLIYQILCYNCNMGRARNGGICPHQEGSETIS